MHKTILMTYITYIFATQENITTHDYNSVTAIQKRSSIISCSMTNCNVCNNPNKRQCLSTFEEQPIDLS